MICLFLVLVEDLPRSITVTPELDVEPKHCRALIRMTAAEI